MQTKVVYALVSSVDDYYLEQAYVSMYSLKRHMPEMPIYLVTDDLTQASFIGIRKNGLQFVEDVITIPLDASFTQQQRSRLIKTSIRQYVTGDYIYIDCDTIICRPLPSLESIYSDIAACLDSHCLDYHDNPYRWLGLSHGRSLDWPIDKESIYFNGGVMFAKDTPIAHEFYSLWQQNLLDGFSKGVLMDQPGLAKTNYQMGHIIGILDDIWNCELKHGIRYLKDAIIVHYLTTNTSPDGGSQVFLLNESRIFDEIKKTGTIPSVIDDIIDDPFKGLSSLTHIFAGKDIYYFQTPAYKLVSTSKTNYKESLTSPNPNQDFLQTPLFFYLFKRYPYGVAGLISKVFNCCLSLKNAFKRGSNN